ncbi:T9SS type B sorting domain-containing protein [Psychroflexus sediminis]|uniref:Gliding motility-associated C-terminal domain-containing protein n=1 Tax=Psychroflexus sediminis TaxID=470826 RepID=A0A1G7ZC86_9FLAO|nr:T9SS type B sorting domain-containing protein [Psychroflexus sediminis]SDH06235.1 gliding motility-associated C-terminal domain-containing protein [Psychroflexus sediminis]
MYKFLPVLFFFLSLKMYAQGEANNWYFGRNAGITFNTNPPTALTDGELSTSEGCSSISDSNGNLLMYTDGRTIWNRNHQIMPNADYFNNTGLNGDPSSTSSGLIVPHPTDSDLYFVFTIDEPHHNNANAYPSQGPADSNGNSTPSYDDTGIIPRDDDGFNNGLNYSIVDMSLRSGLGDVVAGERNNELVTFDPNDSEDIKYKASEKITAVRGSDCNSVWVITHFKDKYYSFLIDEFGLGTDPTPVISQVLPNIPTTSYRRGALGYLKASPNGDKILTAHFSKTFNRENYEDGRDGSVFLYDFDNSTGKISNPTELIGNVNAYGVEFSQDGTKAYAVVSEIIDSSKILQWNLERSDIPNSKIVITDSSELFNALQLGPDGKIYHSLDGRASLGVINNPNAIGEDVNYSQQTNQGAISLNGRFASAGLPPFIQSLFSKRIPLVDSPNNEVIEQVALCDQYSYELKYDDLPNATYTWSKNGVVLNNETGPVLNITIDSTASFPLQEKYRLEVDPGNGDCPLIGVAQITFNKSPAYSDDQLLTCKAPDSNAVYDLTEIREKLSEQVNLSVNEIDVKLYRSLADASSGNSPIQVTSNFENSENLSSLFVDISTFGVCNSLVEFELLFQNLPDIDTADETLFYCIEDFPEPFEISALNEGDDPAAYDYLWSTGEISSQISVNSGGEYFVNINVKGAECSLRKTFIVTESGLASFSVDVDDGGNDKSIQINVDPFSLGDYEFALEQPLNFQDENVFENLNPGIYTVYVRDKSGCGISEKTIGVIGIMAFFTPNGDGINDKWQIGGLLENNQEDILLQVYDRYGKLMTTFTNKDSGWDGTYNGRKMPEDDYWYRVRLTEGVIKTGSFTLKR